MILEFKPQFTGKIISGTKIHTIREDKHNRWKAGNSIQFATGVRTKKYKKFLDDGECKNVQKVRICKKGMQWAIEIDNKVVRDENIARQIIENDGFDYFSDFLDFFFGANENGIWEGKIIHWTDFEY